jgi:arylsulfatase A-like enzyme/tetratricopeptide (TPR) repeat protein
MSKTAIVLINLLGAMALVFVPSCSRDEKGGGESGGRPDVLLITFDTTRADHLGAYGWRHAFTPTLDALAKQSVKFNRAFSAVPETLPSHTTIMTGLFPFYHGVRDNTHFVVDPNLKTLAEVLKENGYQTAAVVAAFVLNARFGLNQGFDTYNDEVRPASEFAPFAIPERNAAAVTDAALDWLESADEDRPFFLWVHYWDPHSTYDAPPSFTKYQGHPYDVEIAYADEQLGRLLNHLEQTTARKRPMLIVFAADHGEALGQYGEATHAYFAYDSTLHVPLFVRMPDGSHAGAEINVPVCLADIFPTVLDVLHLPVPSSDQIHGCSLVPLMDFPDPPPEFAHRPMAVECYEPHFNQGWAALRGVRVGETKFIDLPIPELYVLSENPEETPQNNRYAQSPDLVAELEAAYHELYERALAFPPFTAEPQTPDPDTIEKLRALGYVGDSPIEEPEAGTGKDLKEMLPFYQRTLEAMSLISSGELTLAARVLTSLWHAEPGNPRVLWLLAELAATMPSVSDEVLPILEQAIQDKLVPAAMVPQVLVNCGRIYLDRNDNQRALKCFDEARQIKEDYAAAHWWLALAYLRLNQGASAIAAMGRAVELFGPNVERTRVALGLAHFAEGQMDKGVEVWSAVLGADPTPAAIWRLTVACPLDPEVGEKIIAALQRSAADRSLPEPVRAAAGIVCSNYLSLLQRTESALAALEDVRSLLPDDDANLLTALAELNLRLGRVAVARELLQHAHEKAPTRVDIVGALAGALEREGSIEPALELLESFFRDHPDNAIAANNLAWMLARSGKDLDRALKLAKQAADRQPTSAIVNDTIGWIYHLRGDQQMAIRHLSRASTLAPQNAEYCYHLAVACRDAGRQGDAREAFAQAVERAPTPRPGWYEEAQAAAQATD